MVKSTVRFPQSVIDRVEEMVAEGPFSSRSEFQRFAVEHVLSETGDYEPEMVDFGELAQDTLPDDDLIQQAEETPDSNEEFYETAARVRQFAVRGEIDTAEEYIDTNYPITDPRSMLLDDLLDAYRTDDDM